MIDVFVRYPLGAAAPVLAFFFLYLFKRKKTALVAAFSWLLYTFYELRMKHRYLCSGECNIRVDLLLIYPVMAGLTAVALFQSARGKAVR